MSAQPAGQRGAWAEPPSIADAMNHVVDVGERLVTHRLELAVVELRKTLENAQRTAQWAAAVLLLAASGWGFSMLALLWWLEHVTSRAVAATAVGGLQLGLMGLLILRRERFHGGRH